MKKISKILMLAIALSAFTVSLSCAQEVVVGARLYYHHRDIRPMRPSRAHIWVGGEWVPSGATYTWRAGYWALPAQPGIYWVRGHWARRPRGWVWIPGHWSA
ncbi:MAG TPA: hypothetical protein VFE53_08620 [Mucilaginibacter sp.]|jgi:hypothetical protein|nr:hypothetical protein [Mucilaginibacter sp.]